MPLSKFEANLTLHRGVKSASFSLFTLASSCANAYFRAYAIIDFLADRLVFLNMVTYIIYTRTPSRSHYPARLHARVIKVHADFRENYFVSNQFNKPLDSHPLT